MWVCSKRCRIIHRHIKRKETCGSRLYLRSDWHNNACDCDAHHAIASAFRELSTLLVAGRG